MDVSRIHSFDCNVAIPPPRVLDFDLPSSELHLFQIPLQCTGAAVIASATSVPLWEQSYINGDVGGLLKAMLEPAHGFGKFLVILLSLSVVGNMAMTFYSISLNLQLFVPFFLKVPRYVFSTVGTILYVFLLVLLIPSIHWLIV